MFADIKLYNADDSVTRISINGAWITIEGKGVRDPRKPGWYDKRHSALMDAVYAFDAALENFIKAEKDKPQT